MLATFAFTHGAARQARGQAAAAGSADLKRAALPDAGAWIEQAGRAGWAATNALGLGWPLVNAGLARGGWGFTDRDRAPEGVPAPGIAALPPLTGYDSLVVDAPDPAGLGGPFRPLAVVRSVPSAAAAGRPRAMFGYTNGDFGLDETAITADRGSAAGRIHLETFAARRGATGPYGDEGRHRWSVGLARSFGAHTVSGTFRQAGLASGLVSGEAETARGASGRLAWDFARGTWRTGLSAARAWDTRESFGATLGPASRRDAQDVRAAGFLERQFGARTLGARADWVRGRITRAGSGSSTDLREDTWSKIWLRDHRPAGATSIELGGGRVGAIEALMLAPAIRWTQRFGARRVEAWAERLLEPVWGDVEGRPFLQRTWTAGLALAQAGREASASVRATAGVTRDRAVVARLPLAEQSLRAGTRRDPEAWRFVQIWGDARWAHGGFALGAEGCGLVKNGTRAQALVDPDVTGRAFAECGFRAFTGDLGVRLRVEGEGVGERQTDEAAPRALPAYGSASAAATFTIGDAVITLRARNLEGRRRPEVWVVPATGAPALGPGREVRLAVAWKLDN